MSKHRNELLLGVFMVGALGLLGFLSVAVGGIRLGNGIHVTARFANASGLVKDAAVEIAGVGVGSVESLSVAGNQAVVHLFIRKDAHVRQDVSATIRAKSLLGEKYLELIPHSDTAPLLADGDTIASTSVPVEIDQLVTSLGPVIKDVDPQDIAVIVHSLASTLRDHPGELGTTLDQASQLVTRANQLLAANGDHLSDMVAHLDAVSSRADTLLSSNSGHIDRIAGNLDVTSARMPHLADAAQSALADLPGTLTELKGLSRRLNADLDKLDPLVDQASKMNESKLRKFTHQIFRDDGITVHLF